MYTFEQFQYQKIAQLSIIQMQLEQYQIDHDDQAEQIKYAQNQFNELFAIYQVGHDDDYSDVMEDVTMKNDQAYYQDELIDIDTLIDMVTTISDLAKQTLGLDD